MSNKADRQRIWVVLLVGVVLWGSLPAAIELNGLLGSWSFITFENRNIAFFLSIAFIFGIISETYPFRIGRGEAFEGGMFFGLFILVGLFVMYLRGWWFGLWTLVPPTLYFLSQITAFHLGRRLGRVPRRKMANPASEG